MATIVKIEKQYRDLIEKTLMDSRYAFRFYTMEQNGQLLQCEIDSDSPSVLWHLGKMCGHAITHQFWSDDVSKLREGLK